ncbi:MAG: hypothetical protein JO288_17970 [Hyphomicrobiales bacterium]|nr:hypothetical protein [Hyphomicrobiales bacterium]
MTLARLNKFLQDVQARNPDFREKTSSLKSLIGQMRQQVNTNTYNLTALLPLIQAAENDKRGKKYAPELQDLRNRWGKPILEYKGPHQAAFSNVGARLYVLKTTQVTFREVDTGTQTTHTFSVKSASNDAAGEVAVNLAFGVNTHPVRAIVFELNPTVTFEDPFPGRSQNDLGVNEPVNLGFTTSPAGVTAVQAGDLTWTIVGSTPGNPDRQKLGLLHRTKTDTSAPGADGKAYFIAPWATDKTFPTSPRGNPTSLSTLRLAVQNGPSAGMFVEKSFTVHMPVARMVAKASPRRHVNGKPSAGFIGDIYFDPKNVSFKFIQFKEGRGTMVAKQTGFRDPPNMSLTAFSAPRTLPTAPSGYFAWEGERVHAHTPSWVPIGPGHQLNGCKLMGSDDVYTAPNPEWPNKYTAAYPRLQGKETNVPSELKWPIFWKYWVPGLASSEVTAQRVEHKSTMDRDGNVTTSKAGASVTIAVGAATVA